MGQGSYLSGTDEAGFIDLWWFPFFERIIMASETSSNECFYVKNNLDGRLPTVKAWVYRLRANPLFKDNVMP
jgi:glutathione S-transferase